MENLVETLFYFFTYSVIGWICEDIYVGIGQRKIVNRGFLYGPYCPVYGFGALLVLYGLSNFVDNPILVFIGGVILTSVLEYFTSWIMEVCFHERWWDYTGYPFNINGRVCLRNSTLFGIMALVLMYGVQPHITNFYNSFSFRTIALVVLIVLCLFILDILFTVKHLLKRNQIVKTVKETLENAKAEFEAEHKKLTQEQKQALVDWIKANPALMEKIKRVEEVKNSHISKAFPSRRLTKKDLHDLLQDIIEESNKIKYKL